MNLVDMFYKSYKELRSRLEIPVMPVDSSGVEKFTAGNPAVMQLSGSNVAEDGSVKTTMTSALDSDFDSINVDKMGKGGVTTIHSAIADTATSAEIDCRGYNAILIEAGVFSAAENWTFKVQGCMISGGTFVDWYEMVNTGTMTLMSYQCNAARGFIFKGIPDYVKIVATRDGGASAVTVKAQPLNV